VCSFSIPCLLFSFIYLFFVGQGVSLSRGLCWFSQEWLWEYHVMLICSPVGLLDVSQAGLDLASGSVGAICFLSVTWPGETLFGLEGGRFQVLKF
jgi:hypothetical protein